MPDEQLPLRVTFLPSHRTLETRPGTRVSEAAAEAGFILDLPCGGEGICGKCRVRLPEAPLATPADCRVFSPADLAAGMRLACQTRVTCSTTVEIPETSLLPGCHQILTRSGERRAAAVDPAVRKVYVELPHPCRGDDAADTRRLEAAIGPCHAGLEVLRTLPRALRCEAFRGTAVLADGELLAFEPGDTRARHAAVAVDVGTTTLVAALLDLRSGEPLGVASRLNPQTRFGDDVLSRILHAQAQPGNDVELQQAVAGAVDAMIGELVAQAGIGREDVYEVTLAGNTTMEQLLAGVDCSTLGEVPFPPVLARGVWLRAGELGIAVHPRGRAYLLPVIGGFVGGDIVAGMVATGLAESAVPTLLVDIGTNGEIVLSAGGKLWAAATAAGPAFEGARISQGMRGSVGAIERVTFDETVRLTTIGGARPLGLCGSAMIDLMAELLRHRFVSPEGRMRAPDLLPSDGAADLVRRAVRHGDHRAFQLADADETGHGRPIFFTQQDVRQIQLASGAIRAGIAVLLLRAGLSAGDLGQVYVAGGFGNYIRRTSAQAIGLLPPEIDPDRIRYQGNTSLAGAEHLALSREARRQADALALRTEHVDLSTDKAFLGAFADAMIFPAGGEEA